MKDMKVQLVTAVSAISLSTLIAVSATGDPVLDLEECKSISADSERLACFEAGYDQLRAAGMTSDSILRSRVIDVEGSAPVSENQGDPKSSTSRERRVFGLRLPFFGRGGSETVESFGQKRDGVDRSEDGRIVGISSTATEVSSDAYGKLTITLENGQKWRQTDGDRIRAKVGNKVAIRAGAMGGYFMQVERGRSVRARRIEAPASASAAVNPVVKSTLPTDVKSDVVEKEGMFARFGKRFASRGKDATEEEFGQRSPQNDSGAAEEVTSMTQTVAKVLVDPYDKFIVTLENGQVWQQVAAGRLRIREGDSVTIDQALMGGHMLQVDNKGRAIRVRRAD